MSPALVGLTIVAAATSVPELAVSLAAAIKGSSDIAVGNVVGSNIVNISMILGVAAMISGLAIGGRTIKLEYPVLVVVTLLFVIFSLDGLIDRLDGACFLLIYILFTTYMVRLVRREMTPEEEAQFSREAAELGAGALSLGRSGGYIAAGVALLWAGAEVTVSGAIDIAKVLGLSDRVVGLTVVAVGTSLPEIVASVISSVRGRDDVAIGNLLGSNLFNVLVILGVTAVIKPIGVNPEIIASDNWWMLGITVLIFPIMRSHFRVSRSEGALLCGVYAVYVALLLGKG
jgi:cation:H+ antiporter